MDKKSKDILKGIAAGQSCQEILKGDDTLTYHDIFRAVTGTPTTFWRKIAANGKVKVRQADTRFVRKPLGRWND